jgi:hypothetical protein
MFADTRERWIAHRSAVTENDSWYGLISVISFFDKFGGARNLLNIYFFKFNSRNLDFSDIN